MWKTQKRRRKKFWIEISSCLPCCLSHFSPQILWCQRGGSAHTRSNFQFTPKFCAVTIRFVRDITLSARGESEKKLFFVEQKKGKITEKNHIYAIRAMKKKKYYTDLFLSLYSLSTRELLTRRRLIDVLAQLENEKKPSNAAVVVCVRRLTLYIFLSLWERLHERSLGYLEILYGAREWARKTQSYARNIFCVFDLHL